MVVDDPGPDRRVQRGSSVTIRYSDGRRRVVRLRADGDRTVLPAVDIPADSPIATALLGRRAGDQVHVQPGAGVERWCSPSSGLSDQRPTSVTEQDVTDALRGVAATAHTLCGWVREAGPVVERLVEDYPAAATLLQSLVVAEARPPRLGTPRHLEEAALAILRDLGL